MRDDPVEIFQKITEENTSHKNVQRHLIELIECLYKDLEQKKSDVESLQKQLQSLLEQETFGITSKYVCLKENCDDLNKEIITLKNENDDLQTQLIAKDEETKKFVLEKEEQIQFQYMKQIKQLEDLLKHKDREIEATKSNHKKKEQELYNEIQAVEASSALQLDQLESNFRKQINDLNKKLKESSDSCNVLRNELFNTKEQFNDCKRRIAELQKQLRESHSYEQSYRDQEQSLNNSIIERSSIAERSNAALYNKYQPLEINQKTVPNPGEKFTYKKTPVYRSGRKYLEENYVSTTKNLPPLIQLNNTDNNKEKNVTRKRKLYNPDDIGFLDLGDDIDK